MTKGEILALAARVEQAADRELDADVHEALGNVVDRGCPASWHSVEETPDYTRSIDAALTLVPEGRRWVVGRVEDRYAAIVWRDTEDGVMRPHPEAFADAPAQALTAAALRAIAGGME